MNETFSDYILFCMLQALWNKSGTILGGRYDFGNSLLSAREFTTTESNDSRVRESGVRAHGLDPDIERSRRLSCIRIFITHIFGGRVPVWHIVASRTARDRLSDRLPAIANSYWAAYSHARYLPEINTRFIIFLTSYGTSGGLTRSRKIRKSRKKMMYYSLYKGALIKFVKEHHALRDSFLFIAKWSRQDDSFHFFWY